MRGLERLSTAPTNPFAAVRPLPAAAACLQAHKCGSTMGLWGRRFKCWIPRRDGKCFYRGLAQGCAAAPFLEKGLRPHRQLELVEETSADYYREAICDCMEMDT